MRKFSDCYTEFKTNTGGVVAVITQDSLPSPDDCKGLCDQHATCKAVVHSPIIWANRACYLVRIADLPSNNGWFTAFRKDSCIGKHSIKNERSLTVVSTS